jgi:hypothetical protein
MFNAIGLHIVTLRHDWIDVNCSMPDLGDYVGPGGISALAYTLYCTEESSPFVAVWHGGTIVPRTLAGVMQGPRPLRC